MEHETIELGLSLYILGDNSVNIVDIDIHIYVIHVLSASMFFTLLKQNLPITISICSIYHINLIIVRYLPDLTGINSYKNDKRGFMNKNI